MIYKNIDKRPLNYSRGYSMKLARNSLISVGLMIKDEGNTYVHQAHTSNSNDILSYSIIIFCHPSLFQRKTNPKAHYHSHTYSYSNSNSNANSNIKSWWIMRNKHTFQWSLHCHHLFHRAKFGERSHWGSRSVYLYQCDWHESGDSSCCILAK